jgi:hypothetical protein
MATGIGRGANFDPRKILMRHKDKQVLDQVHAAHQIAASNAHKAWEKRQAIQDRVMRMPGELLEDGFLFEIGTIRSESGRMEGPEA